MNRLFTPEMVARFEEVLKRCVECDNWIAAIEALGFPLDERKIDNAAKRAGCEQCLKINADYEAAMRG